MRDQSAHLCCPHNHVPEDDCKEKWRIANEPPNILTTAIAAAATFAVKTPEIAMSQTKPSRRVMWAASVRSKSLAERLAAAKLGRFDAMSVFPIDYVSWRSSGLTDKDIKKQIDEAGISAAIADPFVQWTPNFAIPESYPKENVGFIDHTEEQVFAMAEALGAKQVNCVEGLGQKHERAALVDALGSVTERATKRGISLTVEPMPISSIYSLADGWDLVKAINSPNLGLTFDTWHFWRATPDLELLAQIPADKITEVQLADAKKELNGDLLNDLLHHRLLPGEGDFDLTATVNVLRKIGAYKSVGPELFSDAMDKLGHEDAGRMLGENLDKWS
jgi:sugar phosphate isomerase/epimerase